MNRLKLQKNYSCQNLVKQNGMTLLEVLVATAILAVISSMAFLGLDTLVQSKQSLQQKTKELNQFNLVQFQLQNDIQMAITAHQAIATLPTPEFIANSQSITLLRYPNATVAVPRNKASNNRDNTRNNASSSLIRVRWDVRNGQWFRSSQSAASPVNSNQWQEQPMLDLKSLNCNYLNNAQTVQSIWPNNQTQNGQLPEMINCQVTLANDQVSVLKLVPWQRAGWL